MVNIEPIDLLKYVTVYKSGYDTPEILRNAIDNAPSGPGYILREYNPWEDQPGMRRQSLHEYYAEDKQSSIDHSIIGGEIFKDFSSRYPAELIKEDDIAYEPVIKLLESFEAIQKDYMSRWNLDINIIQYAPMELRYYEPQSVGAHCDYEGWNHLMPGGSEQPERDVIPNQTFVLNTYLNDDYGDGGEFFINRYLKNESGEYSQDAIETAFYKFSPGDFIIFPCSFPYVHWVSEFKTGRRYMVNLNAIEDKVPTWQFD